MSKLFRIIQRSFSTKTPGLDVGKSRAAFLRTQGQPLTIESVDTETNSLSPKQVKVKVQYCSLNSNDVKFLEDCKRHPLPYIPGYEFSGEILEVGEKVDDDMSTGQQVVGVIPSRCGGLKTEVLLNGCDVWPLPTGVSTKDAAALVCGHSTALLAFSEIRPLDENDVILVIAGAGGFGLAAVDIAASVFKAKVIALADTEGKAGLLRDRGAFAAFKNDLKHNYKEIMNVTDKKGVDIIYDAVGGPILNTVIKCLKDDGVVLGTYRKEDITDDDEEEKETDDKKKKEAPERISDEVMDKLSTISLTDYKREDEEKYYSIIEQTLQFCDEGLISAHISQTFDLEQVNDAIEYIKGKVCTGKVLIKVQDEEAQK